MRQYRENTINSKWLFRRGEYFHCFSLRSPSFLCWLCWHMRWSCWTRWSVRSLPALMCHNSVILSDCWEEVKSSSAPQLSAVGGHMASLNMSEIVIWNDFKVFLYSYAREKSLVLRISVLPSQLCLPDSRDSSTNSWILLWRSSGPVSSWRCNCLGLILSPLGRRFQAQSPGLFASLRSLVARCSSVRGILHFSFWFIPV